MRISLHGGNCCGIKCINGLYYYPDLELAARKPIKRTSFGQKYSSGVNDMIQSNPYGKYDFFNGAAPKETYTQRLDRFITFIKTYRSHHAIEIVLNKTSQKAWVPVLEERGFKLVTESKNSNTMNTIQIFHLVY